MIAIPAADLIDTVIGIGTCSGTHLDKFARFGLHRLPASQVRAPLIGDCLANIECRVVEIIQPHGIVVLDGLAAWVNSSRKERRVLHAVGDGTFIMDGDRLDRREAMRQKLPEGL